MPTSRSNRKPFTVEEGLSPTTLLEQEMYVGSVNTGNTRVIACFRQAMGDAGEEYVIDWPADWRLPRTGESVTIRDGLRGIVSTIDFDIEKRTATIWLR